MNVYVARQAIFDENRQVVAYELLFRSNDANKFTSVEGLNPTLDVIKNSFSVIGFDKLTEGKKAFINFDEELLKSEIVQMLPKNCITIEVLETVEPSHSIIESCKKLKELGYTIALDDFEYSSKYDELLKYVDIIKVDFILTKGKERNRIIEIIKNKNIKFLAEKVETEEEYREALEYGYSYFQGYFFCKPIVLSSKEIPIHKFTYFKLIRELNKKNISIADIESLVKSDLSLSYKLLKIVNSAHYGVKTEIKSIRNAIMIIGLKELKRWIFIITLKNVNEKGEEELLKMSLLRAYFGELLARKTDLKAEKFDVFLTGLFSLIDALMNQPLNEILNELPVSKNVKEALLTNNNELWGLMEVVIKYEKGEFEEVTKLVKAIGLDEGFVSCCYIEALENLQNLVGV